VRFWTKFLKDLGYIAIDEPAKKLINQGMIQGRSNFVYRIIHWPKPYIDEKGVTITASGVIKQTADTPTVFISKNQYDLYNQNDNDVKKLIKDRMNELFSVEQDISFIAKIHVDVNIVNNDILDQGKFKESREEYKNAQFITEENGDYICGHEVEKMSKSKFNVVTPDDIAEKFGSDTLRLYEMFLGPLEQSKPWNTNGITGVHGFLKKLWKLFYGSGSFAVSNDEPTKGELKTLHKTIKKITEDIERFSFNTSVSNFMICVNELTDAKCNKKAVLEPLLICLSPYAPHIAEELWKQLGHTESITFATFPLVNEEFLIDDSINYPVSVNGKLKFTLELASTLTKEEVEIEVMKNEQTIKLLAGQQPKKVIVVHKKIVNMVV
jgi:leucyl-tRNA synthetase